MFNAQNVQMFDSNDLFDKKKFCESMNIFLNLNTNPAEVIKLFPDFAPNKIKELCDEEQTCPKLLDRDHENSLLALIEYLRVVRQRVQVSPNSKSDMAVKQNKLLLELIDTNSSKM